MKHVIANDVYLCKIDSLITKTSFADNNNTDESNWHKFGQYCPTQLKSGILITIGLLFIECPNAPVEPSYSGPGIETDSLGIVSSSFFSVTYRGYINRDGLSRSSTLSVATCIFVTVRKMVRYSLFL